jgi:hypothetical protein
MFTPPSIKGNGPNDTKGTIQLPGSVGGADWEGGAFDPETGLLYVQSITGPFVADIIPGDPKQTNLTFTRGTREYPPAPLGLPLLKPPYGRITAIDLNTGTIAWMVANGDGPRDHPLLKPLNLPPLGNPGRSAPLATKTLLFVGEGDPIMASPERTPKSMPLSLRRARVDGNSARSTSARVKCLGDGVRSRHDRRADELHVQRQTVHRRRDRIASARG